MAYLLFQRTSLANFFLATISAVIIAAPNIAYSQSIPGPADIDRTLPLMPETFKIEPAPSSLDENFNSSMRYSQPPKNADQIKFKLSDIKVIGVSIYSEPDIRSIYDKDLGQTISLLRIWQISDEITKKYRQDGYFLSRAFIPAQEIADGHIVIRVAEGYIKQIEIEEGLVSSDIVKEISDLITSEKPISSKKIEEYNLLLTDLAGLQNLFGTLAPLNNQKDGGVRLIYSRTDKVPTSSGYVGLNNFGSKFLGPSQASAQWQGNLIGLQQTFIGMRTSVPTDELSVFNLSQTVPLTPKLSAAFSAGYTHAKPGFTLATQEIKSSSIDFGINLTYKVIRQRAENLSITAGIDGRNSQSTILGSTELSEDKVRTLRLGTTYDRYDPLNGYNRATVTGSKGFPALGASSAHDSNISRDGAKPDFSKVEIDYLRYQALPFDMGGLLNIRGQKSSGSLYSSEEFGFGGQDMGRAYDSSEITGDDGIALSFELQYNSVPSVYNTSIQPYAFYDIGKVWNRNTGQTKEISASSTGLGFRANHSSGISSLAEIAFPLTKEIDNPIYGGSGNSPRINLQMGYKF